MKIKYWVTLVIFFFGCSIYYIFGNSWHNTTKLEDKSTKKSKQTIKHTLKDTIIKNGDKWMVTNPTDILVVVNKQRFLSKDYIPPDLVTAQVPFKKMKPKMRKEAALHLEKLFNTAKKQNIKLSAVSAYRSYKFQVDCFSSSVRAYGEKHTKNYVALPGSSEHQTGLTIDVLAQNFPGLTENFANTKEGLWLKENAHRFGFIIRYPEDKELITGYKYEPWHIRYIGKNHAEYIYIHKLTLEEYIDKGFYNFIK